MAKKKIPFQTAHKHTDTRNYTGIIIIKYLNEWLTETDR